LEIRAANRKTADGGNADNGLSIEHQKTKTERKIWQTNSPRWQTARGYKSRHVPRFDTRRVE